MKTPISLSSKPADKIIARNDSDSTNENSPITINILSNDTYSGNVSVAISDSPGNGDATLNGANEIVYTPSPDYYGTDSFSYTITDINGSDTADITITVKTTRN